MQELRPNPVAALLRHGDYHQLAETPSAHQPFPLTGGGKKQALQAVPLIREFCERQGLRVYPVISCSQLLRAWQTAKIIADELGPAEFEVRERPQLAERCVGSAANLSIQQIEKIIRQDPRHPDLPSDWKSNSTYRLPLPGAESLLQSGVRVAQLLQSDFQGLSDPAQADHMRLYVGHGGAFRHAAYHLGLLQFEEIARLSMHHCRPVFLAYQGRQRWSHVGGAWKQRTLNQACSD